MCVSQIHPTIHNRDPSSIYLYGRFILLVMLGPALGEYTKHLYTSPVPRSLDTHTHIYWTISVFPIHSNLDCMSSDCERNIWRKPTQTCQHYTDIVLALGTRTRDLLPVRWVVMIYSHRGAIQTLRTVKGAGALYVGVVFTNPTKPIIIPIKGMRFFWGEIIHR